MSDGQQTVSWLELVSNYIAEVFWLTNVSKTEILYISPGYERVWGRSCESLRQNPQSWLDSVHPQDRDWVRVKSTTQQALGIYDVEYRIVKPSGEIVWIRDRAFPVRDETGCVYCIAGIAEDITERKRAEMLLHAQRDLGMTLSLTSDLQFALETLLNVAASVEGIDCGGVYLVDAQTGSLSLIAHRGLSPEFVQRVSFYPAGSPPAQVVAGGQPIYSIQSLLEQMSEPAFAHENLRGIAILPLVHEGVALGSLNLASHTHDEISSQTRGVLEAVAAQASGAIARIRAAEALQRSEARLRAIAAGAPVILFAGDDTGTITFEDGQGLKALGIQPGAHVGRSIEDVFGTYPAVLESVRRVQAGEEFSTQLRLDGLSFDCWFSPTRSKEGRVTGFVAVATNVTDRQRLQRQILEISDREQARIGQDLHDGLCQQLVSLAFDANSLEQQLKHARRPEAATARRIAELLDISISESRRLSRGLFPVRLEGHGLHAALDTLASSTSQRFGIRCEFSSEPADISTSHATATHLYRIAQEAVANAIKHSKARNVLIVLRQDPSGLELAVRDDGDGFDQAKVHSSTGMGLHIMEYRARAIGGAIWLTQNSTGGATLICRLPQAAA